MNPWVPWMKPFYGYLFSPGLPVWSQSPGVSSSAFALAGAQVALLGAVDLVEDPLVPSDEALSLQPVSRAAAASTATAPRVIRRIAFLPFV